MGCGPCSPIGSNRNRRRFNLIDFETAWSPARSWVRRASPKFPTLRFELTYAEPGMNFLVRLLRGGVLRLDEGAADDDNLPSYLRALGWEEGAEVDDPRARGKIGPLLPGRSRQQGMTPSKRKINGNPIFYDPIHDEAHEILEIPSLTESR